MPLPKSFIPDTPSSFVPDSPQENYAIVINHDENKSPGWRDQIINFWRPLSQEDQKAVLSKLGTVGGSVAIGTSNAFLGAASGTASFLLHPLSSIYGTAQLAADALNQMFPDSTLNPRQKAAKQTSLDRLKNQWESIKENPDYAMGNLAGGILAGKAVGDYVGPATKGVLEKGRAMRESVARGIAGNAGAVKPLVEETLAANKAAEEAHLEEAQGAVEKQARRRETALEKGRADVEKFQSEKERVAEENRRAIKAQQDRAVLPEKRAKAYRDMQAEVETTRANARKIGNAKFNTVNAALNPIEADQETIAGAVDEAREKLKGTEEKRIKSGEDKGEFRGVDKILDSIQERFGKEEFDKETGETNFHGGKPLTYEDLQGYYTELGKELSKGNLDGDVFQAYNTLHEAIGDEMQRIADSHGGELDTSRVPRKVVDGEPTDEPAYRTDMGKKLYEARKYWRRMKQAFGKKFNIQNAATETLEASAPDIAKTEEYKNQLRLMSNPEWGGQGITKAQATLDFLNQADKALPEEAALTDVVKPNPARPKTLDIEGRPIVPSATARSIARDVSERPVKRTIGTRELTEANREALRKFDNRVKQRGFWIASGAAGYKMLSDVFHGRFAAVPMDIAEGAAALGVVQAVAKMLENPSVQEAFTHPSDAQIAAIPPELRGDLRPVVEQAQRQGIKVSPNLLRAVGIAAWIGPRTRQIQEQRGQRAQAQ